VNNEVLGLLQAFDKSAKLCFHDFTMIQTSKYLCFKLSVSTEVVLQSY